MTTTITNVTELQAISNDLTGSYVLGNDIPASGTAFTPLGTFTGTLEGAGYKVKDLTITISAGGGTKNGALITTNQGTIQNLGLYNCQISVTSTDLNANAGGIAVDNYGTIRNCYVTGTITAIGSGTTGWSCAGGLVTWNESDGVIDECYSTTTITVTSNKDASAGGFIEDNAGTITKCYATGNVTVSGHEDMLAGSFVSVSSGGTISNCYAKGDASATGGDTTNYAGGFVQANDAGTITNCYSIGTPTGASGIGGFCRDNSDTITGCFWDTQTSGTETSDGGTGKTTSQMKAKVTFTAVSWDFVNIWAILSTVNNGYPYLGTIGRVFTLPDIYDGKGRVIKGARVRAYRNDTHAFVEEQTVDAYGNATFTELPNDVDVSFQVTWGGSSSTGNSQWLFSRIGQISDGGTGASDAATARTNFGLGIGDSPQFEAINLGHASDTTIARVSAGKVSIEGKILVRMAAQVVAANDSYIKTQADLTCDGVDD